MTLGSIRQPRTPLIGAVAASALLIVASLLGGVANATPPGGTFSVSMTSGTGASCVKAGSTTTITATITNKNSSTGNKIGSIFLDASQANFNSINFSVPPVLSRSDWTAHREDAYSGTDKSDLDGVYLTANNATTALLPGQGSISVTFTVTVGASTGSKSWTDSAWTGTTPRSGSSFTGTTNTVNVSASCAQSLTFVTGPSSTPAGGIMSNVAVKAWSAAGGTGTGVAGEIITLSSTGLHNSSTATTNSTGMATFSGAGQLTVATVAAPNYAMKAAIGTISTTALFNISNAPVASVAFTSPASGTQVTSGGTLAGVNVVVRDTYGNPVNGAAVTLSSSCLVGPGSGTTNAGGALPSALNLQVVNLKQSCSLHAGAVDPDTIHTAGANLAFSIISGPASSLIFSTPPTSTVANKTMGAVVVTVSDGTNPVANESVTVSSPCLQAPATGSSLADGTIAFNSLAVGPTAQNCTMTATDNGPGAASAATATFQVLPDTSSNLTFDGPNGAQPTNTLVNDCIDNSGCSGTGGVQVYVTDAHGNTVADGTDVTISIGSPDPSSGGATLGGTLTQPTTAGIATFPDLTIDTSASNYILHAVADDSGAAANDSDTFDIASFQNTQCSSGCQLPDGSTLTTSDPATIIVEPAGADFGCDGLDGFNPAIGGERVITIEPQSGNVTVTMDTPNVSVAQNQGVYPMCKVIDDDQGNPEPPILLGLCTGTQTVGCINKQQLEFLGDGNALHTTYTISSTDPHMKGP